MIGSLNNNRPPRVLVYCGVHNGQGLSEELRRGFDVVYGFDANPEKIKNAKKRFPSNLRQKFHFFNYALTDKNDEEIEFNIFENWDASSSLGDLNPEYGHAKTGVLKDTPVNKIKVKTINLGDFLSKKGVKYINRVVTDLQGNDLTVVKTLKEYIDKQLIEEIKCEVEWDEKPSIYNGLNSNKLKDFNKFLDGKYKKTWHLPDSEDWWETDIEFKRV
jgi:FkbM family methyltransferase